MNADMPILRRAEWLRRHALAGMLVATIQEKMPGYELVMQSAHSEVFTFNADLRSRLIAHHRPGETIVAAQFAPSNTHATSIISVTAPRPAEYPGMDKRASSEFPGFTSQVKITDIAAATTTVYDMMTFLSNPPLPSSTRPAPVSRVATSRKESLPA